MIHSIKLYAVYQIRRTVPGHLYAIAKAFFIYLNGKPKLKYNRSPSDLEEAITLSSAGPMGVRYAAVMAVP